jgi:hypothetical protein
MEIRLQELGPVVDHFYVLESRQTFRNTSKPLTYPHVLPRLTGDTISKVSTLGPAKGGTRGLPPS